jgi:hypothetical protein
MYRAKISMNEMKEIFTSVPVAVLPVALRTLCFFTDSTLSFTGKRLI